MNDTTIIGDKEKQVVRKLVIGTAVDQKNSLLGAFYGALDDDGYLVELARTRARFALRCSLTHELFAQFLGLENAKRYRATLLTPTMLRASLIDLARLELRPVIVPLVELSRTPEFLKWSQAHGLEIVARQQRRGRPLGDTLLSLDDRGQELEDLRVEANFTLKEWAQRVGTSENTYRLKLDSHGVPEKWLVAGRATLSRRNALRRERGRDVRPVTSIEFDAACGAVWRAFCAQRDAALKHEVQTTPNATGTPPVDERFDLDRFSPSDEVDLPGEIA